MQHTSLPCRTVLHCTFARSFNERPNSLRPPTLICNTFIEGHPNFLQNIFLCCWNDLLPFYRRNSLCTVFWVSSFYLSVNIVLYQFTVTCIENWSVRSLGQWIIESKVYLLSTLGRKKKVQYCDYVFGSSTKFQRGMTGFVKADIRRQVSVCLRVFCGILFALKPFRDYSLCSVCTLPQSAFYSQSVVCILPLVRSPQSAFYTDRLFLSFAHMLTAIILLHVTLLEIKVSQIKHVFGVLES